MTSAVRTTLIGASLSIGLCGLTAGQSGAPPASSLDDITACALEGEAVFIVTGRDASARRYSTGASGAATEFPVGAQPVSTEDLARRVSGKVFNVELQNGLRWRLDYKANGYLFVNVSNGVATSGPWRAQDGRLCAHTRNSDALCSEVREHGQRLYLRRDNGEVIALNPQ